MENAKLENKKEIEYLFHLDEALFDILHRAAYFIQIKNFIANSNNNPNLADFILAQRCLKKQKEEYLNLIRHIGNYRLHEEHIKNYFKKALLELERYLQTIQSRSLEEVSKLKNLNPDEFEKEEIELIEFYKKIQIGNFEKKEILETLKYKYQMFQNKKILETQKLREELNRLFSILIPLLDSRFNYIKQHEKKILNLYKKQEREIEILIKNLVKENKENKFISKFKKIISKDFNTLLNYEKKSICLSFEILSKNTEEIIKFVKTIRKIENFENMQTGTLKAAMLITTIPLGPLEVAAVPFWLVYGLEKIYENLKLKGNNIYIEYKRLEERIDLNLPIALLEKEEKENFVFST